MQRVRDTMLWNNLLIELLTIDNYPNYNTSSFSDLCSDG